jgi:hypothetical protein
MKAIVNWLEVDWSKQDVELAAEHGVSRERVRQARKAHGAGKPIGYRKRTGETAEDKLANMETGDKTLLELATLAGCTGRRVAVLLKGMGKSFLRRKNGKAKYDWSKLPEDWESRSDKELAILMGIGNSAVVATWRHRHGGKRVEEVVREASFVEELT